MEIPKYIEVKTAAGQRAAFLSPNDEENSIKDCFIDCRLNAESTLEFMIPATSEKIAELTPECQIWAGGRVYSLLAPETSDVTRDEKNKLWAKFMAVERWKDLETSFAEPYISNDPTIPHPSDLAVIVVGSGTNLSGGLYQTGTAAHALYAVLQGSGWTLGACDVPGIHDLEMEKESRLAIIKKIQNIWGGFLVWDSVNKKVSLRSGNTWQNYTGFQVRYKKNLKHITRTQSNRIITKLYCFGHDDLDIASVNGGIKFLRNNSYTSREYVAIYKNQDIYNAQELKEKGAAELSLICRPQYKYSVNMVDLRTLPEYSHEDFTVGDMVDVVDDSVAPGTPRVRLIRHKYNVFKPWICELEIGDPLERLVENLKAAFETTSFIDNIFKGNGQLSGYSIEVDSISANKIKTNELIVGDNIAMGPNARISWSNVTNQPNIAQIALDKINATYIDANGVWTPNVYAKNISTINGKITTAQIENLVVGGNVTMGPNATISWSKVTNQPDIPKMSLDAWKASGYATYIDEYGVYAGTVYADKIEGGVAKLANSVSIGGANPTGKVLTFGSGAEIRTGPSTFGPTLIINASEVDLPSVTCFNLHVDGNLSGVDYATSGHTHGNSYIKSQSGQNISLAVTDIGVVVRLNGSTIGNLMFD